MQKASPERAACRKIVTRFYMCRDGIKESLAQSRAHKYVDGLGGRQVRLLYRCKKQFRRLRLWHGERIGQYERDIIRKRRQHALSVGCVAPRIYRSGRTHNHGRQTTHA
jgi:hypothetical protein